MAKSKKGGRGGKEKPRQREGHRLRKERRQRLGRGCRGNEHARGARAGPMQLRKIVTSFRTVTRKLGSIGTLQLCRQSEAILHDTRGRSDLKKPLTTEAGLGRQVSPRQAGFGRFEHQTGPSDRSGATLPCPARPNFMPIPSATCPGVAPNMCLPRRKARMPLQEKSTFRRVLQNLLNL